MKQIFILLLCVSSFLPLSAKVKLPAVLADNMVLQQQTSVNLWGETDRKGKISVTVSWNKRTYTTQSHDGQWSLKIPTPGAGGPYTITVSDGEPLRLNNILIGEVWLCGGQSNMAMLMRGFGGQPVEGALDAIAQASPGNNIRLCSVKLNNSQQPQEDCEATWQTSNPQSVAAFSATAWFFGQYLQSVLKVPIGLISSNYGGTRIQTWMDKETFETGFPEISLDVLTRAPQDITYPYGEPTLLYNAMIHPIRRYTIRGVIWYQGETNRNEAGLYGRLFPEMVAGWRRVWKQGDFPFYYVQIAPYNYDHPDSTDAAALRQAQLEALTQIPNSGMAVTADIGHPTVVHPPAKKQAGQRLALWALAKTYGREGLPHSGLIFQSAQVTGRTVTVIFQHAEAGIVSDEPEISGFELAGRDGVFYPAKARFAHWNMRIQVECEQVDDPVIIRYCYRNYCPVHLFSNFGLPASPFEAKITGI